MSIQSKIVDNDSGDYGLKFYDKITVKYDTKTFVEEWGYV